MRHHRAAIDRKGGGNGGDGGALAVGLHQLRHLARSEVVLVLESLSLTCVRRPPRDGPFVYLPDRVQLGRRVRKLTHEVYFVGPGPCVFLLAGPTAPPPATSMPSAIRAGARKRW